MKGEGREEGRHNLMRSTHPCLFQRVGAKKRNIDLRYEGKGKVSQPYVQSTLDIDVSLHGGIPPRRPPDPELVRDIFPFGSPLLDSGEVKTLEESSKVQMVWDELKEEAETLPYLAPPTLTICIMLTEVAAVMEDGTFMVQGSFSMDLEK